MLAEELDGSPELKKIYEEGKLTEDFPTIFEPISYLRFLDAHLLRPSKDTLIASDSGYGTLIDLPKAEFEMYWVFSEGMGKETSADRVSVLLYEEQKELMDQLVTNELEEIRSSRGEEALSKIGSNFYRIWGCRSFLTLELIMRARQQGAYPDKEPFEPFADPKNKELLYETLPYLFGRYSYDIVDLRRIRYGGDKKGQELVNQLVEGLGVTSVEVLNAFKKAFVPPLPDIVLFIVAIRNRFSVFKDGGNSSL